MIDMFVFPEAEVLRTDAAFRKNGRCFRQHESRPADCATSEMDKVPIVGVTIDARILAHRRDKHTVAELEVANGERIKKMWHEVYATSLNRICDCGAGLTLAPFRPNGPVTLEPISQIGDERAKLWRVAGEARRRSIAVGFCD